jgi:phage terminase large subunit-like protein
MSHLSDIARELRENDDLIAQFQISGFAVDIKTDIVVNFKDGHQCRIIAKGSGQKMRGLKWNGKRPGLIVCDDLEDDAQIENKDSRDKFQRWFLRAVLPCRRRGGVVRVHGTILHEDSLLAKLMKAKTWTTKLYKAHNGFDDFTDILWPESFPVERLMAIRQDYIEQGDAAGYSQEYLNDPLDNEDAYLRKEDFIDMSDEDQDKEKIYAVGCDFAVSKKDKANRTSFTIGGKCNENYIHIVDERVGRWDTLEWINIMFQIQSRWSPAVFFVEDGVIWKSIAPTLYKEMQIRDRWINCQPILPTKDKATRGRPLQKHHRAGGMRFDMSASWYGGYEAEMLRFTGVSDAAQDDQFDSTAILVKGFETMAEFEDEDFLDEEQEWLQNHDPRNTMGRSSVTGY